MANRNNRKTNLVKSYLLQAVFRLDSYDSNSPYQ